MLALRPGKHVIARSILTAPRAAAKRFRAQIPRHKRCHHPVASIRLLFFAHESPSKMPALNQRLARCTLRHNRRSSTPRHTLSYEASSGRQDSNLEPSFIEDVSPRDGAGSPPRFANTAHALKAGFRRPVLPVDRLVTERMRSLLGRLTDRRDNDLAHRQNVDPLLAPVDDDRLLVFRRQLFSVD